jgi:hypothetical protein
MGLLVVEVSAEEDPSVIVEVEEVTKGIKK